MNVTMNIPVLNTHMGYLSGKSIKFKDISTLILVLLKQTMLLIS